MKVKITRKYQITIPKGIRKELALVPGEKLLVDVLTDTIRIQRVTASRKFRDSRQCKAR